METIEQPTWETEQARLRISAGLSSTESSLVVTQGPCAPEIKSADIILTEGRRLNLIGRTYSGLTTVQSLPMSKPRSNPTSWKGEHSTNPELALEMVKLSAEHWPVAMEIVEEEQIDIYVPHLSLAWTGARSKKNFALKQRLASEHQNLPLMIKNGLDGDFESTLEQIDRLRAERDIGAAAIVLCYRGGENAKISKAWIQLYKEAYEATGGLVVADAAHGAEQANDPLQEFQKSELGQHISLGFIIRFMEEGLVPAGIKIEASDAPSPVDPVIPFELACKALMRLRLAHARGNQ